MQNAITGAIEIASIRSTSVNTQLTLSHIAQKYKNQLKIDVTLNIRQKLQFCIYQKKIVLHLSNFFFCCHSVDDFRCVCVCVRVSENSASQMAFQCVCCG